jgi:DNA-binding MarR family transcriptional regulator
MNPPNNQPIVSSDVDRVIHEPARYQIMALLSVVDNADFLFLLTRTGLTRGNLSSHVSKLETAGYVTITKQFVDKIPRTLYEITPWGREAFGEYRRIMRKKLKDI